MTTQLCGQGRCEDTVFEVLDDGRIRCTEHGVVYRLTAAAPYDEAVS